MSLEILERCQNLRIIDAQTSSELDFCEFLAAGHLLHIRSVSTHRLFCRSSWLWSGQKTPGTLQGGSTRSTLGGVWIFVGQKGGGVDPVILLLMDTFQVVQDSFHQQYQLHQSFETLEERFSFCWQVISWLEVPADPIWLRWVNNKNQGCFFIHFLNLFVRFCSWDIQQMRYIS